VALDRAEVDQAIATYYDMAGYDKGTGAPTAARLAKLGVEWAANLAV
jgi:aldehyde:ferredoxin oxidoreductase